MQITLDKLKNSFDRQGKKFWTLYAGKGKGRPVESNMKMTTEEELDGAWDMLELALDDFGPGIYTIELRSSPSSSRNNPIFEVIYGDVPQIEIQKTETKTGQGAASIGSFNNFQSSQIGMLTNWQMGQIGTLTDETRRLRDELHNERMKSLKAENKRDIDSLRLELAPQPDSFDKLLALLENNTVAGLVNNLTGQPVSVAVGTLRATQGATVPALTKKAPAVPEAGDIERPDDDEKDNDLHTNPKYFSIDEAVNSLMELQAIYPERNVHTIINALVSKAKANPELITYLL